MTVVFAILLTLILILLNGFFVAVEFALIGARRTRMEQLVRENNRSARVGLGLMKDLPLTISGAQLGITITSLGLGLVAEPAFASILEKVFDGVFVIPSALAHWLAFGIAIFIVVFLHMVIGEMVPKNFALTNPEKIACQLARTHRAFVFAFRPVIWVLNQVAALLLKPFKIEQVAEIGVAHTSQEIQNLLEQAKRSGQMDQDRHALLTSALQFQNRPVKSIMVPWGEVDCVQHDLGYEQMGLLAAASGHSRFPVIENGQVIGFLHVKDLLYTGEVSVEDRGAIALMRELLFISPELYLDDALRLMRESQIHFAIVGNKSDCHGIVTLEDVLEVIVGEIVDETDKPRNQKSVNSGFSD
ncbi:MAG: hypothetical protein CL470_05665 [Acidimicrobiaceae bacterium]|nr:hypothetical protein [Acidimicrobiaceae bacterium]